MVHRWPNREGAVSDASSLWASSRKLVGIGSGKDLSAPADTLEPALGHFPGALHHVVSGT